MSFRDSLNNLIRSDKPDSPTDLIFLYGSLILIDLWVWATLCRQTIPHLGEMIGFLITCKVVKVGANLSKKGKTDETPTDKPAA